MSRGGQPTSFWVTVRALLRAARLRRDGRMKRQSELMRRKSGSGTDMLGCLGTAMISLFMILAHGLYGYMALRIVDPVNEVSAEREGMMVIPSYLSRTFDELAELKSQGAKERFDDELARFAESHARERVRNWGGDREETIQKVMDHYHLHGPDGFTYEKSHVLFRETSSDFPPLFWTVLTFVFGGWMTMMIFQGEGLELDVQRVRHPMWEWLMSHPIKPVAAFSAEMLTPAVSNPLYFTSPVFWWVLFGGIYGGAVGFLAAILVGIPFTFAASALNKALEISLMLRLSIRNRGAVLGLMSWLGYVSLVGGIFVFSSFSIHLRLIAWMDRILPDLPQWPLRTLLYGWGETASATGAIISGALLSVGTVLIASYFAWWGMRKGLQAVGGRPGGVVRQSVKPGWLGRYPLYRKELLWFWRDKGAVVQVILIPLTIGAVQAFNLRGLASLAVSDWNIWCGFAVICGTYFLIVLGPRSLASEGAALWISLTWPSGLEELLKAKARLWWVVSSGVVGLILVPGCFLFPGDLWRIAIVALGWVIFSFSLAEKSVALVTAPNSSGDVEPPPRSRQWAVMIGTLAFGVGVMTKNWHVAVIGVVFSSLTAAAIWQNLRARLPHLFDPWTEKLPPAPTVMHAVIAIALISEAAGIGTVMLVLFLESDQIWFARSMAYGLIGALAWACMHQFLEGRDVDPKSIWTWPRPGREVAKGRFSLEGLALGAALGGIAALYVVALKWLPLTKEALEEALSMANASNVEFFFFAFLAIAVAPFAEEYLFRGLLFRALDREWGTTKALIGSSAFFAIYHPPLSWLPVFLLGLLCAWLFRRNGRLWAPILAHMAYNTVIVLTG
jgi:membrane protease YdiL (CAAX protease family)